MSRTISGWSEVVGYELNILLGQLTCFWISTGKNETLSIKVPPQIAFILLSSYIRLIIILQLNYFVLQWYPGKSLTTLTHSWLLLWCSIRYTIFFVLSCLFPSHQFLKCMFRFSFTTSLVVLYKYYIRHTFKTQEWIQKCISLSTQHFIRTPVLGMHSNKS